MLVLYNAEHFRDNVPLLKITYHLDDLVGLQLPEKYHIKKAYLFFILFFIQPVF